MEDDATKNKLRIRPAIRAVKMEIPDEVSFERALPEEN